MPDKGRADRDERLRRREPVPEKIKLLVEVGGADPASDRRTVAETPAESLHSTAGVDDLLLARVERVALGADVDVDVLAQG